MTHGPRPARDSDDADASEPEHLPEPVLPDQPREAERPMPFRAAPERTADPSDWDVAGDETVRPRPRQDPVELAPEGGRDLRDEAPPGVERESSYSTELQQGAVHPHASDDGDADQDVSEAAVPHD
jgi:hypothetical protein